MIRTRIIMTWLIIAALSVAGCDNAIITGISETTTPGILAADPVRLASLNAEQFGTILASSTTGEQLLTLSGAPTCGVDVYYFHYWTLGGQGERTNASGALMLPTGGAGCSGPRPVVLYAHGTAYQQQYNIAKLTDRTNVASNESALIASMYAAQGFIVVAPNYAGYDVSTLSYHPYLNAEQQSSEMRDALAAARAALSDSIDAVSSDNGQLLLAGYSQGGHVAMATMKAMQAANEPVTAIAAGSGPYALEAFGDAIIGGKVIVGATVLGPLVVTSYQKAYGDIYATPADLYNPQYATYIEKILPTKGSIGTLFYLGLLPLTALLDINTPTVEEIEAAGVPSVLAPTLAVLMQIPDDPVFAAGFSDNALINNAYRINYMWDAVTNPDLAIALDPSFGLAATEPSINPLRRAFYNNDMRKDGWFPLSPMFLCGGSFDPTVFFVNAQIMKGYWDNFSLPPNLITVYDVNPIPNPTPDILQAAFTDALNTIGSDDGEEAAIEAYHSLVAPFCAAASRDFFLSVI